MISCVLWMTDQNKIRTVLGSCDRELPKLYESCHSAIRSPFSDFGFARQEFIKYRQRCMQVIYKVTAFIRFKCSYRHCYRSGPQLRYLCRSFNRNRKIETQRLYLYYGSDRHRG
ncbi:hypothetical protein ALC57_18463 [Trachymyrmex cornetzi]|uniref:Uncharacterized protein n=1 Tax=Trachymyrmex cornetzi TaxID=471704 RepID=A0A151IRY0_9HYME|nr:hypothetical protein ALC57_18463 [Trachymyrmex cornetzi]